MKIIENKKQAAAAIMQPGQRKQLIDLCLNGHNEEDEHLFSLITALYCAVIEGDRRAIKFIASNLLRVELFDSSVLPGAIEKLVYPGTD